MTDEEREDQEALRYYVPGGRVVVRAPKGTVVAEPSSQAIGQATTSADSAGIIVDVQLSPNDPPAPNERRAGHTLPAHRPTRYALHLRRQAANRKRALAGDRPLPPVRAGDCQRCAGWGVVGPERERCPRCLGSGGS